MEMPLNEYIKLAGVFKPTRYVYRPFGTFLEVDRCEADGRLVTNSQASLSAHPGHHLRSPVVISFFEMILIWLRIIR